MYHLQLKQISCNLTCRLIFWELRARWQKVTQYFSILSLSPQTHLNHFCNGCCVSVVHQLHPCPSASPPHAVSLSCKIFFSPSFFPPLISSSLPYRDWARAPASAHFERCCRLKNARSKHMRAVFIINQLYGPLMEVISVKFMLRDLAVLSKTAAR